jgi:hypothetical protein
MSGAGQATRLDRLLVLLETGAPAARKIASDQIGDLAQEGGQTSIHALVYRSSIKLIRPQLLFISRKSHNSTAWKQYSVSTADHID